MLRRIVINPLRGCRRVSDGTDTTEGTPAPEKRGCLGSLRLLLVSSMSTRGGRGRGQRLPAPAPNRALTQKLSGSRVKEEKEEEEDVVVFNSRR